MTYLVAVKPQTGRVGPSREQGVGELSFFVLCSGFPEAEAQ